MLLLNGQYILHSHKDRSHWMTLREWLKVYLHKNDVYINRHFKFLFQVAQFLLENAYCWEVSLAFFIIGILGVFLYFLKKYIKLCRRYIYPQRVLENESDCWFVWVSITLFFPGHLNPLSVKIVLNYFSKIICFI